MRRFASNLMLILALSLSAYTAGLDWLLQLSYATRPAEFFSAYRYAPSLSSGLFMWVMVPSFLAILSTMVLLRYLPPAAKGSVRLLVGALNLVALLSSYMLLIGPDPSAGVPAVVQIMAGLRLASFTVITGLLAAVLYQEISRQLRAVQEADAAQYQWSSRNEVHDW
jgi:hypothetical protein